MNLSGLLGSLEKNRDRWRSLAKRFSIIIYLGSEIDYVKQWGGLWGLMLGMYYGRTNAFGKVCRVLSLKLYHIVWHFLFLEFLQDLVKMRGGGNMLSLSLQCIKVTRFYQICCRCVV